MKVVKVGIVGLGNLGMFHANSIREKIPNGEVIAICGNRQEQVDRVQKEWGTKYAYINIDEMLQNKEIEAVLIVSSANAHYEHACKACEADVHVFCEKPLGLTIDECIKIEELANKNEAKIFTVGFQRRYDPSYVEAMEKIKAGEIGKPLFFRGYSLDPVSTAEYLASRAGRNGQWFMEMTVHDIDLARWFLGSEAETVYATGGAYMYKVFEENNDVDNGFALMKMKNGTCAFYYSGKTAPHGCHVETEIVGEKGTIRINAVPNKSRIQLYNEHGVVVECLPGFFERWGEAYYLEIKHFIDCIAEGKKPEITAFDGRMATQTAQLMQNSYERNELLFY